MDTLSPQDEAKLLIAQMVMKGILEIPTSSVRPYLSVMIESSSHLPVSVVINPIEFSVILLNDES